MPLSLPVIALRQLPAAALPLIERSRAWPQLRELCDSVTLREPPLTDAGRWHEHTLGGVRHRFGQPLTFTPYAATQPCSARCKFCSEALRDLSESSATAANQRPGPHYFEQLGQALSALRGVPLSYSLSGLEATDDSEWFLQLLATLRVAELAGEGPKVEGAVLYTNGSGLARDGPRLLAAMEDSRLSWIEWSRHHDDAETNQAIMRFRPGLAVRHAQPFEQALQQALARFEIRLVCVVQLGGVCDAEDVMRYIAWARRLGVRRVIFRAFSLLPDIYQDNGARRYIESHRVPIDDVLLGCLATKAFRRTYRPLSLTSGYYFWNARWEADDGHEVVFEASDYGAMREHEESGLVYKLVFHANGNLCAGWHPQRHVLWRPCP